MCDDLPGTLARARRSGVTQVLQIGCDRRRMETAVELAEAHDPVFACIGIHPHEACHFDEETAGEIVRLSRHAKVLAIGETGLDYYYDHSSRGAQREAFARQISLAREVDLPLVLHVRDAHQDAWEVVAAEAPRENPGMVHCFTGGPDEARRWLDLGWHLSFSGIVTFRAAALVREAAVLCPTDRILLETDAPFLAPEPVRGRKNEPANVAWTCAYLAEARGETAETLAAHAAKNTRELLDLPLPAG